MGGVFPELPPPTASHAGEICGLCGVTVTRTVKITSFPAAELFAARMKG